MERPVKKKHTSHVVVAIVLLGTCTLVALALGALVQIKPKRRYATLTLPDGVHAIEHSRVRLPAICAEYSRDVTYLTNGVRGKTTPLQVDGCGGYPINCYLIETPRGPLLRLDDAVAEHLLDVTTQTTYAVTREWGKVYIGELRDERACTRWSMMNNDPSTISVAIGDVKARPMADLTQDAKETYLGRFGAKDGQFRFIPANESPEITIRHHYEEIEKMRKARGLPPFGIDSTAPGGPNQLSEDTPVSGQSPSTKQVPVDRE